MCDIRIVFGDVRYDSPGVVVVDQVIRAIFAPVAERERYAVLAPAKDR
jgi:hypothetical protein